MNTAVTPIATTDIYGKVVEYLKSINVPFVLTDYGIKVTANNVVVEMYIYNSTWVLHAIVNNAHNSLSSDMYVKQTNDACGTYLVSYDKEKTKVWVKVKLSGNQVWDNAVPFMAFAKSVELAGKSLTFLLPQSMQ
jgi:hypothetical protein